MVTADQNSKHAINPITTAMTTKRDRGMVKRPRTTGRLRRKRAVPDVSRSLPRAGSASQPHQIPPAAASMMLAAKRPRVGQEVGWARRVDSRELVKVFLRSVWRLAEAEIV